VLILGGFLFLLCFSCSDTRQLARMLDTYFSINFPWPFIAPKMPSSTLSAIGNLSRKPRRAGSGSSRTITIVLSADTCVNDERKPCIAKQVSFADQAVTVEAVPSAWADAFTHAKLLMNTQGLVPDASSDLQRR
jgi:hypothetical protein